MKSLTQRPLLLAALIFVAVLGALLLWIAITNSGLNPDVYNP